jgi:hypothetical protein
LPEVQYFGYNDSWAIISDPLAYAAIATICLGANTQPDLEVLCDYLADDHQRARILNIKGHTSVTIPIGQWSGEAFLLLLCGERSVLPPITGDDQANRSECLDDIIEAFIDDEFYYEILDHKILPHEVSHLFDSVTKFLLNFSYTPSPKAWDVGFFRSNEERADAKFPSSRLAVCIVSDGAVAGLPHDTGISLRTNTTTRYEILEKGSLRMLEVA